MPNIGDILRGDFIGRCAQSKYIYAACPECGIPRWVQYHKGKDIYRCPVCATKHNRKIAVINPVTPTIGEIRRGREIGKIPSARYQWLCCNICNKARWVRLIKSAKISKLCASCNHKHTPEGKDSWAWKGGLQVDSHGYRRLLIYPDNFFYSMADKHGAGVNARYIMEHRLVMAQSLGRCLNKWEVVHHKNGIKDDNRLENLELSGKGQHSILHSKGYRDGYRQGYADAQNSKVKELLERIRLLEWELKQANVIPSGNNQ